MKRKLRKKVILSLGLLSLLVIIGGVCLLINSQKTKLELIGDKEIRLACNSEYKEEGAKIKVFGSDDSKSIKIDNNININKVGTYKVKYSYNKGLVKRHNERLVTVYDDESPVITLNGKSEMHLASGKKYEEPGYEISDNCNNEEDITVNISGDIKTNPGTYEITYEAIDKNGNSTKIVRKVIVDAPVTTTSNNVAKVTYIDGILIVNKTYALPSNYNPGVNSEAYSHLKELQAKGKELGYSYALCSGFRSYTTQKNLYNYYVSKHGKASADTFSARPGHSEHQTGLAFDIGKVDDSWANTDAYKYLKKHAHEYGFIIRYPEGKQGITGYKFEPWHVRYLGVEIATKVYESGKTLEEYLGVTSKYGN